jgi:hypothetical protein
LIRELEAAHENDKHQVMWKIAGLDTPPAMRYLCHLVLEASQPLVRRKNALTPLGPRVCAYPEIETTLFQLLDDEGLGPAAASYLAEHGSNAMLHKLHSRWPADAPPRWAHAAAARLIPRLGDEQISALFLSRIEHKAISSGELGRWESIPENFRHRLLALIRKRPLDTRKLVYQAAKSACVTGQSDAVDHVCDKLAKPTTAVRESARGETKLPGLRPGIVGKWDYGWTELQLLKRVVKEHPEHGASPEAGSLACRTARVSDQCPVLENQERWFVLLDEGHPGADGRFRITIIDATSREMIKSIERDGRRRAPEIQPLEQKKQDRDTAHGNRDTTGFPVGSQCPPDVPLPANLPEEGDVEAQDSTSPAKKLESVLANEKQRVQLGLTRARAPARDDEKRFPAFKKPVVDKTTMPLEHGLAIGIQLEDGSCTYW